MAVKFTPDTLPSGETDQGNGNHHEAPVTANLTPRALIIGFLAIVPAVFWGVYGEVVSQTDLMSTSVMMPPILVLTILLLINVLIRRLRPGKELTQAELLTVYTMLTVSVVISGMGMIQFLLTSLGAVPYYSTPQNQWDEFLDYVPGYIMPELYAIEGFYRGNERVPWGAWAKPLAYWSAFLFAMLFTMTCINTILRKQWMDQERLPFPVVILPLEMTDPQAHLFKNKLMWMGFLLACSVQSLNSLNYLYPNLPSIQIRPNDIGHYFSNHPWTGVGYLATTFYPLVIGLGFLLPVDVSFSCWFFFMLTKAEAVGVTALGWSAGAGAVSAPPYIGQQGTGAFIGVGVSMIYLARRHIRDVVSKAITGCKEIDDSDEPLSYRTAVLGLGCGALAMVVLCVAAGVSPMAAIAYLGIYLVLAIAVTRMRAVAAPAWHEEPDVNALDSIINPLGSGAYGKGNLIALAFFNWFSIEMRCCPMPHSMEGMKMAQTARVRQRAMMGAMILAMIAGIVVGFWACLSVWYEFGAASAKVESWRTFMGRLPFDKASANIATPRPGDIPGTLAMGFGAGVVGVLTYIRNRFVSFPLHPVGYMLANTASMIWLWMPFLIAWACKVIIVRYGGMNGYRIARPFFLGLILGDFIVSSVWALAGSLLGVSMYRCFP